MCSNEWLKFCTCSTGPVDKTKPYWVLYSSNRGDNRPDVRVGTITIIWFSDTSSYEDFSNSLIDKLKSSSLFDFEYEPNEGDIISIHLTIDDKIKINLRYESGEWWDLIYGYDCVSDFYIKRLDSGPFTYNADIEQCI